MNRRGFLKGLSALAVVPVALKQIAAKPELNNLEKAKQIDANFNSPFLYVEATEDLKQGDMVLFVGRPTEYKVKKASSSRVKPIGISCADVKKGNWYFVQTVGHCKLPVSETNYFKTF